MKYDKGFLGKQWRINLISFVIGWFFLTAVDAGHIEPVNTSTAGFLGITERGPTTPQLVTSWLDFQRKYGSYVSESYLPYVVNGFFTNGGERCYIGRITARDASKATLKLTSNDLETLTLEAIGEGSWGSRIVVKAGPGSDNKSTNPLFKLTVYYWKDLIPFPIFDADLDKNTTRQPTYEEIFDNVSVNASSPDHYELKVNGISNLIKISKMTGDLGNLPNGPTTVKQLGGTGLDGTVPIDVADYKLKGLRAFKEIDEISIVYIPNADPDLVKAVIAHCEDVKDRFAIIDADKGSDVKGLEPQEKYGITKYAAFYYPWIKILDPITGVNKLVPPGGYVAGIFARTDKERGVHKAPANEVVRGAIDLEFQITKQEQDILNPRGVNVIRSFAGRGILVWGARTLSDDSEWKYVNVRRLFIFIEESIVEGTRWVVFEPNDETLWAKTKATVSEFLMTRWKEGALMGTKPQEAFFVKCDRSTMTQEDIDNGRLVCIIGVAPMKPAEFVIFRIGQWSDGSDVTE